MSSISFACGNIEDWMDVYEGEKTGNSWRDKMTPFDALVMMRGCSQASSLGKSKQNRLLKILTNAVSNRLTKDKQGRILKKPTANKDIRNQVKLYQGLIPYDGLVESIYRRYNCLLDVNTKSAPKIKNTHKTIYQFYGLFSCKGFKKSVGKIKASNGANLRAWPKGRVITQLKNNLLVEVVGLSKRYNDWYRVINPINNYGQDTGIGYLHKSTLVQVK